MKVLTIVGTRPELIRLSEVLPKLDGACEHVFVHTGQNFDPALRDIFFAELALRAPDFDLGISAKSPGEQIGRIVAGAEEVMLRTKPDRLLILGDTNSGLAALIAKRLGIRVFHMEAGNRSYDDEVPEEVNRRVIDHSSDVLLPYTERSRENLLREGIRGDRIFVTGNPILEVIEKRTKAADVASVVARHQLEERGYLLVTLHRAETVDHPERLRSVLEGVSRACSTLGVPAVVSVHPRTRNRLEESRDSLALAGLRFEAPFGFVDFVALERGALCVVTDSGTVQEEACLLRVPSVIARRVTERPETIECGSSILAGRRREAITEAILGAVKMPVTWAPPADYVRPDVASAVCRILMSEAL